MICRKRDKGFTLVELAIVLTIIGLLIGGVLKGQELLFNARITRTINDLQSLRAAHIEFRDKYGQLPGDMSTAATRIPGCTGTCVGGNGNSLIGKESGPIILTQPGMVMAPFVETSMYWQHLVLSDFITGVSPGADPAEPIAGKTHPTTPLGGTMMIGYSATPMENPNIIRSGNFVALSGALSPSHNNTSDEAAVLTPHQAWRIDTKIDDGTPNWGAMVGENVATGCKDVDGSGSGEYQLGNDVIGCHIYWLLDG